MVEIIPTIVPRDLLGLEAGVNIVRVFSSVVHLDVDDGLFAPHLTWPYTKAGEFAPIDLSLLAGMSIEVHLMVEEPREVGSAFARAGASRVIGHLEAFSDTNEACGALDAWRQNGAQEVGLGLLMETSFEVIEPLLSACNVVHLMSIATIGTQGIPYDPGALARIAEFHARFPTTIISVDGGVSKDNIAELARAGATRFGVGSAIMRSDNPAAAYEKLKSLAESTIE